MSFFKKLFGKNRQDENAIEPAAGKQTGDTEFRWIEASANRWHIRLLDLTSLTQKMLSSSTNQLMAQNAVSYGSEDGTSFWNTAPESDRVITADISFPTAGILQPGVLFTPNTMEHKWAIYFDGAHIIFVRSWLRQVFVRAQTRQEYNCIIIENIQGIFTPDETPAFTRAVLNFLLISHAMGEISPAPLPSDMQQDPKAAALWAFSAYGKMAYGGVFSDTYIDTPQKPLRTHSLLHIAAARSNVAGIEQQVQDGANIEALAGDGLTPLQWSVAAESTVSLIKLLELGANPNGVSAEGATAIMNAVQSNKKAHLEILLKAGANVNATDSRGFTALHRAGEMGHLDLVQLLLAYSADKNITAENHTALSLAETQQHKEIIRLLKN